MLDYMAKQKRIKLRLSINLSEDDLGLTRLFKELAVIESDDERLSPDEIQALKRRHLLSILYKYCGAGLPDQPATTALPVLPIAVANAPSAGASIVATDPAQVSPATDIKQAPAGEPMAPVISDEMRAVSGSALDAGGYAFESAPLP